AADNVLSHFGRRAEIIETACCGRPFISNGMLDRAVRQAEFNVALLHDWAKTGKPIIACEPSCILTIKDDYPALLRGELRRKAEVVAAACSTFDHFLENTLASGGLEAPGERSPQRPTGGLTPPARRVKFRPGPKRILVHPHCHE